MQGAEIQELCCFEQKFRFETSRGGIGVFPKYIFGIIVLIYSNLNFNLNSYASTN